MTNCVKHPAESLDEAIALTIDNANRFNDVLNGDVNTFVTTCSGGGQVPSVAKALAEAAAYKVPLAWDVGQTENDLLQPRDYNGNTYVPLTVPAVMDATPSSSLWRLFVGSLKAENVKYTGLTPTGNVKEALDSSLQTVATLAELLASTVAAGSVVYVKGRTTVGDGYQGDFRITTTDYNTEVAADAKSANYVLLDSGLYAVRADFDSYDVRHAGVKESSTFADIQAAIDAGEALGLPVEFDGAATYQINGNVYLGNVKIITNGCVFAITVDGTFTKTGTATRRNEGVFLSKSAALAGYGLSTVAIVFDELKYTLSVPANISGFPRTAFLMENASLTGDLYECTTASQATNKVAFDLYTGNKNVHIKRVNLDIDNQGLAESAWVREMLNATTENIQLDYVKITYNGADESLAVFNSPALGATTPTVKNVNIGTLDVTCTGNAKGAAFLNNIPGNDLVQNCSIGTAIIRLTANGSSNFGFKFTECGGRIDHLIIEADVGSSATGAAYLLRQLGTALKTPSIGKCTLRLLSRHASATAAVYGASGQIAMDSVTIESSAAVKYTIPLIGNSQQVGAVHITAESDQFAVKACAEINGTVYGKMEGVLRFNGTQYCDTNAFAAATWWSHSGATLAPDVDIYYRGRAILTGAGTATRIASANATLTYDVPMYINYTLKNVGDLTVGADFNGGSFKLAEYQNIQVLSTGAVRRTKTLSL